MPELMVIFLAVMLTDIILLDLYNTFGLPTSTTVSIVFELLGAAVAVSLLKLYQAGDSLGRVGEFINTGKALTIIFGILLSVGIAFLVGATVQFVSRILFTFDFQGRVRRYGALWGGVALSSITYFILIKGSKGAAFITPETLAFIKGNAGLILLLSFAGSALVLQLLLLLTKVNILKVVVLAGTFALAMAFAANDLVNFIGVPLAGFAAYTEASASGDMVGQSMEALREPVRSQTGFLVIAGAIMVITLWISKKARTVTKTEVSLGRQDEGYERFESTGLSRAIVRLVSGVFRNATRIVPAGARRWIASRLDRAEYRPTPEADGTVPSFDLIRAGVNLMVASALIAWATSLTLPLSTTYVTFMVAMGTSLSDQAWGRESAVFRVTGVLTVIGGWFFTAMMAFSVSFTFGVAIFYGKAPAVLGILALAIFMVIRTHLLHRKRVKEEEETAVFNLRKIKDSAASLAVTFEHAGIFLKAVSEVVNDAFEGLFDYDRPRLRKARYGQRRLQQWSNIIAANIFKVLRLLQWEDVKYIRRYAQTISSLQEISESTRDLVIRAKMHVSNHHAGLLEAQKAEMERVRSDLVEVLQLTSQALLAKSPIDHERLAAANRGLRIVVHEYDQNQVLRIQDNSSKTRLSILFYSFMWDSLKIAEQTSYLLTVFQDLRRPEEAGGQVSSGPLPPTEPVSEPTGPTA
jgi:phosphate/sulfate permease